MQLQPELRQVHLELRQVHLELRQHDLRQQMHPLNLQSQQCRPKLKQRRTLGELRDQNRIEIFLEIGHFHVWCDISFIVSICLAACKPRALSAIMSLPFAKSCLLVNTGLAVWMNSR